MNLYKAFLLKALELGFPHPPKIDMKQIGGITYIAVPMQNVLIEFHGLWHSNGYDSILLSDGAKLAESNGWNYLLIEESVKHHGIILDAPNRQIKLQRMETKAVRSGLKRCVKLSELVLTHLTGKAVCLSPEQIEECTQYALEHSVLGNKAFKKQQER